MRSVSIVCQTFVGQARALARLEGFPDIALAVYPGHVSLDDEETFMAKLHSDVVPQVMLGLTQS